MAFCSECGSQLALDDRFCSSCGTRIPGVQPAVGAPVVVQPRTTAQSDTNGMATASFVLGILCLAGVGSLLAIIFANTAKRQIQESGGLKAAADSQRLDSC